MSLPDGPGSLEGVGDNVSVNPNMGVMSESVPFQLPAGFPGATPSLAISYSSGSGNGDVGVGWSLLVPSVERMTARGLPQYVDGERFVADGGEELVAVDRQNGDSIYRARYENSFVRWLWHSPGAAGYWEAQYPDGRKAFFGADRNGVTVPEARVESAAGQTFRYHLVETIDVHGHRVRYDYRKSLGGSSLLTRVRWLFLDATTARYAVELGYESRSDVLSDASGGFEVQLDERLRHVDVFHEAPQGGRDRIRGYQLSYHAGAWLSQLERVTQFGLGDLANSKPYPIVHAFKYTQALGASSTQTLVTVQQKLTGAQLTNGMATLIDLNGDALPDVVDATEDGTHRIWIAELDSNGTQRFKAPIRSALSVASRQNYPLNDPHVVTLDVNGDGFTDLMRIDATRATALINKGQGDWVEEVPMAGGLDLSQAASFRYFDYDGDRRIDVLQSSVDNTDVFRNTEGGQFVAAASDTLGVNFNSPNVQMADMNGDGLQDVVWFETGFVHYRMNLGWGRWGAEVSLTSPMGATDLPRLQLEDLNGDALADLVAVHSGEVKYALNRSGASFDDPRSITTVGGASIPPRDTSTTVVVADMNGNGSQDIVWIDNFGELKYLEMFATRPNLLTRIENGLGHVTDVKYVSTVVHMARAREAGKEWRFKVPFPMTVVDTVDEWDQLTGVHDVVVYRYDDGFYDGNEKLYRGHGRVELRMEAESSQEEGLIVSEFNLGNQDPYLHGQLLRQTVYSGGRLLSQETHEVQRCAVELETAASPLIEVVNACTVRTRTAVHEGTMNPMTTEVRFEHDGYGNVTKETKLGVLEGCAASCSRPEDAFGQACGGECLGDELYAETSYVPRAQAGGQWILHAPFRVTTRGRAGGLATETLTYYDGSALGTLTKGLATRVTKKASDSEIIEASRLTYDGNGQPIESLDANGNRRTYRYDGDGLRVIGVAIHLNGYQLERHVRYDERFAKPVWASDWMRVEGGNASGQNATAFAYDDFGRMSAIHKPDPTTGLPSAAPTQWFTYDLRAPASRIVTHATLNAESVKCVDGRGREYQTKTRTAEGRYMVTGFTIFNTRGETLESYQPYASASASCDTAPAAGTLATRHRYDAAHREIARVDPAGGVSSVLYLPFETQELDANDNDPGSPFASTPTVKRTDGLGRLAAIGRTLEAGQAPSMLTATYDELGNMSGYVDAAGNRKTQRFDLAGRLLEIQDPNAGKTTFQYDPAGNVVARTDARGITLRMAYDAANRLVERWEDGKREETLAGARYDRDPDCTLCSNTAGRVASLFYPDGKDTNGYDVRGRAIYTGRELEGFLFETRTQFDDRDRLIATTYPDDRTLTRSYDDAGRLVSIDGVINNIVYDDRGLVADTIYANNTDEKMSYDERMMPTSQILDGPNGPLQALAYTRDRVGNILEVVDSTPDTEIKQGGQYTYDAWYRLLEARLDNETLSYRYNEIDNILSATSSLGQKSALHLGDYAYAGGKPNAVTAAGTLNLKYDEAGNVIERGGMKLTWDALGRLTEATLPDEGAVVE